MGNDVLMAQVQKRGSTYSVLKRGNKWYFGVQNVFLRDGKAVSAALFPLVLDERHWRLFLSEGDQRVLGVEALKQLERMARAIMGHRR